MAATKSTRRTFALALIAAVGAAPVLARSGRAQPLAAGPPVDPIIAQQVIARVNGARAQAGLAPVVLDPMLSQAAQSFAQDLARRRLLAHTDASGADLEARVHRTGYRFGFVAENVAAAWPTAAEAVASWLASPDNRANLLAPAAQDAGVGFAFRPEDNPAPPGMPARGYRYYWVLDLASKLVREPGN